MASLTNRYTAALFGVAQSEGSMEPVTEDLQVLAIALKDRRLRLLLENPAVRREQKAQVLGSILRIGDRQPHARTLRFIDVVLKRGRQGLLPDIVRAFRVRALEIKGEVEGRVETAVALDADDLKALEASLGRVAGKRVMLESRVVPELLGGFRVRVADRMFDASLRGQIEALGRKLKGIPIEDLRAAAAEE